MSLYAGNFTKNAGKYTQIEIPNLAGCVQEELCLIKLYILIKDFYIHLYGLEKKGKESFVRRLGKRHLKLLQKGF